VTTTTTAPLIASRATPAANLADVLVIGGSVVAPLNLLLVRSLTVYDLLVGAAFVMLLKEQRLRMPPSGYVTAALVFLMAAALSSFRATHAIEAVTQILQYAFIFFVQIPAVLSVVRSRRAVIWSIALVCVGSVGAILHAYLTQDTQGAGRVLVFYSENPNRLGYPAAYLAPLLLVLWSVSRHWSAAVRTATRAFCLGSGYLSVWAIAASASRSSAVGAIAAVVVYIVLRPGCSPARMVLRASVLAAVVAISISLLSATGTLPTTLEERVQRSFASDDAGTLVGDREHLANAAANAFVEFPYLGTGLDNFRYVTTNYDLDATPQLPHNLWLQLLVQVGIFGTLAFALLLLLWLRDLLRARALAPPGDRSVLWGLFAAMCGVLTIFMFAPEMLDRHYWLFFALGLAVAVGVREDHTGGVSR
jgi:O-antigen ligase